MDEVILQDYEKDGQSYKEKFTGTLKLMWSRKS